MWQSIRILFFVQSVIAASFLLLEKVVNDVYNMGCWRGTITSLYANTCCLAMPNSTYWTMKRPILQRKTTYIASHCLTGCYVKAAAWYLYFTFIVPDRIGLACLSLAMVQYVTL